MNFKISIDVIKRQKLTFRKYYWKIIPRVAGLKYLNFKKTSEKCIRVSEIFNYELIILLLIKYKTNSEYYHLKVSKYKTNKTTIYWKFSTSLYFIIFNHIIKHKQLFTYKQITENR